LPSFGDGDIPIVWAIYQWSDTETFFNAVDQVIELFQERTGLIVEPVFISSYKEIVDMFCNGEAHIGDLDPFSYISANSKGCAEVAFVEELYGGPYYGNLILARTDRGIESVTDFAGKTFCHPDGTSVSGWVIPKLIMLSEGIDPEKDLGRIIDTGSHEGVFEGLLNGTCDIGGSYQLGLPAFAEGNPGIYDITKEISASVTIPYNNISYNPILPLDIQQQLSSVFQYLTTFESGQVLRDLYNAEGLYEGGNELYDSLRMLLNSAGVDVDSYFE
jgi:phosphonate transport system substrate-binding protein